MKYALYMILIGIFSCCTDKRPEKTPPEIKAENAPKDIVDEATIVDAEEKRYDFDTILKKGYHLSYRIYSDADGQKMQSLTLVKGDKNIKNLNSTSYPTLNKSLGYIGADFGNSFVFTQSFGSGNPHEIQLIDKQTGREFITGTWVDADEKQGILVYIKDIHKDNEQLRIFDVNTGKQIIIDDFNKSICYKEYPSGLRDCVEIDTVSNSTVVLKIDTDDETIVRTYIR